MKPGRGGRPGRATSLTFVLALVASVTSAQLLEDYRFKGAVVDGKGKGLDGVKITFRNPSTGKRIVFETDKKGNFDRRMIPTGIYDVSFKKKGYQPVTERFDWSVADKETVVKETEVVLVSDKEKKKAEQAKAKAALGKKAGKLYRSSYDALAKQDYTKAKADAEALLEIGAGSYEHAARFVVARSLLGTNQTAAAIEEYQRVIALKPDLFEARFDLARAYQIDGQLDAAVEQYQAAAELHPDDSEIEYSIGAILFTSGDYAAAKPHLVAACATDSSHANAHKALGYVLLSEQEFAEAKRVLNVYLELTPDAPDKAQVAQIIKEIK